MDDHTRCLVLDNGSGSIKCGFSGEESTRATFSNVIGRHRSPLSPLPEIDGKATWKLANETFLGEAAQVKRGILALSRPMEHGQIVNWEDMQRIWEYAIVTQCKTLPEDHPVLLTEPPLGSKVQRGKAAETLFEQLNVPGLYFATDSILVSYLSQKRTCLLLGIGDGVTSAVPIYQGTLLPFGILRQNMGGRDLTAYLRRLLETESGHSFSSSAEAEIVREIKEELCFVKGEFEENMIEELYVLPDGSEIQVGPEAHTVPEALFKPSLLGLESNGIHLMVHRSILACPIDTRKDLYENIHLFGGSTLFPLLAYRLKAELTKLVPSSVRIGVTREPDFTRNTVWRGGAIFASFAAEVLEEYFISQAEYEEYGVSSINRKYL